MTTSVKERIKAELEQAQVESKQRANRIGDILKAAASMTFEEIKEGSSVLNVATRKSVAEVLEELQETPQPSSDVTDPVDPAISADSTTDDFTAAATAEAEADNAAPTWRSILLNAVALVRDRKGDWFQAFKKSLNRNAVKFDQEMSDEYGDRYLKVRSFFQRIVDQVKAQKATSPTSSTSDGQPVTIEVMDDDDLVVDVTPRVQTLESETER